MRIFKINQNSVQESNELPLEMASEGYLWMAFARREFEVLQEAVQQTLDKLCQLQIVDLHLTDMLNNQLPSHFDFTSDYDLLIFRRLASGQSETDLSAPGTPLHTPNNRSGPPVLRRIDTSPVAFLVLPRILITVHPTDCSVRDSFANRLLNSVNPSNPGTSAGMPFTRMPHNPSDLMLRIVSQMVDGYLNLRRELTRQLDHWQSELLNPRTRFKNWSALLDARLSLHMLDEISEDQRSAIQDWIDSLDSVAKEAESTPKELELLKLRSRDVLEHIERVVHHVRRLEQSAETAVEMHFNAQSNRTNEIMRTLTVLTAIFLPLNLITGFFGMNFENFPYIHSENGVFWTIFIMGLISLGSVIFFWRKRYLGDH
jgi:Mg2+ and Co2+ transporter CorA